MMSNTFFPRFHTSAAFVALIALSMSCGKKSSKKDDPLNLPTPTLSAGGAATTDAVQGYWLSACAKPPSGLFALGYARREYHFDKDKLTVTVGFFDKDNCDKAGIRSLLIIDGSYSLGDAAKSTGSGSNFDITVADAMLVPMTATEASFMNAGNGTCGAKDWTETEAKPVKDVATCDYMYTAGLVPFHVLAKDGDKLTLGAYYQSDDIGKAADKRPTGMAVGEELVKASEPFFMEE